MRVSSVARLASCREQDLSDVAVNSEINGESSRYQKKVDYFRKYRSETKDRRRVYRRDYYVRNKDSETKYFREFYLRNKDTVAESSRCYNAQDLDRKRKWNQDHYARNQTRRKAMNKLYYIQNKNDPDSYVSRNADNKSWKTPELVREYFETIGKELHIADHTDWYRISRVQLNQLGGASLFKRFANLGQALQVAYPEFDWDLSKFSLRGKKSGQRWLRMKIEELLPGVEILEEYHHPDLIWADTNRRVELDFWIPKHKIGIEYQGEHHYFNVDSANGPSGTASLYSERDLSKISLCQSLGISLIVIPYWWDESIASLSATLYRARPDVFPVSTGAPIPTEMPGRHPTGLTHLMLGTDWHQTRDPSGWIMTEKLDGFRGYWNGKDFVSKNGKVINAPRSVKDKMPAIALDGELWGGYDSIERVTALLRSASRCTQDELLTTLWQSIQFCIFDAPLVDGHYRARREHIESVIKDCDASVSLIPMEVCLGLEHLETKLREVTGRKGEGLMIYHPEALYTEGRTSNLLKVKAYEESDVTFLRRNPNSNTFACQQANGAICNVRTNANDYRNEPEKGSILTVRYSGYWRKSEKFKYPVLLRVRTELE